MEVKTIDPRISPKIGPNLARNLKRLIEARGVTAYRVAKDAGISHRAMYCYLDPEGESDPATSVLIKLCRALHCQLSDLVSI